MLTRKTIYQMYRALFQVTPECDTRQIHIFPINLAVPMQLFGSSPQNHAAQQCNALSSPHFPSSSMGVCRHPICFKSPYFFSNPSLLQPELLFGSQRGAGSKLRRKSVFLFSHKQNLITIKTSAKPTLTAIRMERLDPVMKLQIQMLHQRCRKVFLRSVEYGPQGKGQP